MRKFLALFIIILLVVSLSTVIAHEEEEKIEIEELEEIRELEREREVEIKTEVDKVEIESKLEKEEVEGELENKFEVEFKVSGEVEIKLEYEEEFETNLTERELELEYEIEFDSIIEFIDLNRNDIYDKGEEVSTYELDGAEFTAIDYTTGIAPGNVTEHIITTQTIDGIFKVTLHVVGDFANIEGEVVRPTEIKIDLGINNFNYTNETSKLALKAKIESEMETEEEKEVKDGEDEVEIRSGNYTGFFSWRKTALIDGIEKPVLSTSLAEDPAEDNKELYLIYERGASIAHDPKIGVVVPSAILPVPFAAPDLTYLYFAIVAIILVGIIAYILRRR